MIVQHGVLRNGDEYRDFWVPAADKHKLLIVALTFSNEIWPGVESYNNGRVFSAGGNPRHIDGWTYALVGSVVRDLIAAEITDGQNVYLFGHSAGGQFVHRLMSSQSHAPSAAVAAGNPGWYTLPTFDHPFPEGMAGVGLTEDHLVKLLAYPMTILAGDQDIATDDPNLPRNRPPCARPHRFARAQNYFEAGRKEAERRGVPFNWTLQSCPASATTAAPCRRSAPASGSMAACPTTPSWPAWPASRSPDRSLPPSRHPIPPCPRPSAPNSSSPASSPGCFASRPPTIPTASPPWPASSPARPRPPA